MGLPYLIHGIILEIHLFQKKPQTQLNNAIVLGVGDLRLTTTPWPWQSPYTQPTPEDTDGLKRLSIKRSSSVLKILTFGRWREERNSTQGLCRGAGTSGAALRQKPDMWKHITRSVRTYRALAIKKSL